MKYLSMYAGIAGFEKGIEDAEEDINEPHEREYQAEGSGSRCSLDTRRNGCKASDISRRQDKETRRYRTDNTFTGLQQWRGGRISTRCVGYSEIDKYASAIYRYHYPETRNYGDATRIDTGQLPDFDLLVGGFPCQSFSVAGKRGGLTDVRGTLFFEIARIAQDKKPAYLWLENVKGLLSAPYTEAIQDWNETDFNEDGEPTTAAEKTHRAVPGTKGWVFLTILNTLWEIGYDCQWQVLNSRYHGVPQNRERVFIIGHIRNQCRPQVFPIGIIGRISTEKDEREQGSRERVLSTIDARYGSLRNAGESYIIHTSFPDGVREYNTESPTISTPTGGGHLPLVAQAIRSEHHNTADVHYIPDVAQALPQDGQLRSGASWGTDKPQSSRNIRRLTPKECERLQGFPDDWTKYGLFENGEVKEISDTQRYKCCGNAVTTNVIRDIWLKWRRLFNEVRQVH